jgi:hypothetical protein
MVGREGARPRDEARRSHLPLRGKLGWMTPGPARLGRDYEAYFEGSRSQAGALNVFEPEHLKRSSLSRINPGFFS